MRGLINDFLRWLIEAGVRRLGPLLELLHRAQIRTAGRCHDQMRRRYRLTATTPVVGWSAAVEESLQRHAAGSVRIALTSGTTTIPKRVPYSGRRLRAVKFAYSDMFIRGCRARRIRRTSVYVFGSLDPDDSLTSLLLNEDRLPSYFSTLQAPYRVQRDPSMLALASTYGPTALRLWILTIANPGVLYSTNPSTLSIFLDALTSDWLRHARLVHDFCERPEMFDRAVHSIARRLESRGSSERLARIANSRAALPLHTFAPGVEAYVCWTGGQVQPFLDRLAQRLAPDRYHLIPMYSMSTETIETVPHFEDARVAFLPLARGVCYEFIEEGAEDRPENLRTADQLRVGKAYAMVVSDRYGLRRYQTGDLFQCKGFVGELPDLEFLRRRELSYSFTGEKVTAEQLTIAFERLREECQELRPVDFLTCIPCGEPVPHYKLVLTLAADNDRFVANDEIARRCDRLLGEINCEYRHKRDSGRLGGMRVVRMSLADLAARARWENQFKLLPLSRTRWESPVTQQATEAAREPSSM